MNHLASITFNDIITDCARLVPFVSSKCSCCGDHQTHLGACTFVRSSATKGASPPEKRPVPDCGYDCAPPPIVRCGASAPAPSGTSHARIRVGGMHPTFLFPVLFLHVLQSAL